jgi:hypothetical protein
MTRRTAFSTLASLGFLFLIGCGSDRFHPFPKSTASTGAAIHILVSQGSFGSGSQILRFSAIADGSVSPLSTISLPADLLIVESMGVDPLGDIYVAGRDRNGAVLIVEYSPEASGSSVPIRRLSLGPTGYDNPGSMGFDAGGDVYVGLDYSIAIFSPGSTLPSRVIAGSATQIDSINGIAIAADGTLYATTGVFGVGSVLVFAPNASGNAAPARTITGTPASPFYAPSGIALDMNGHLYVAAFIASGPPLIFELDSQVSGLASPIKTIYGSATTLDGIGCIQLDGAQNLYVENNTQISVGTNYVPSIVVFDSTSSGNVKPTHVISSPTWNDPAYGQIGLE